MLHTGEKGTLPLLAAVTLVAQLQAQIAAKEVQLGAMRGYLTPNAPEFKQAQGELSALRAQLGKAESTEQAPASNGTNADYVARYHKRGGVHFGAPQAIRACPDLEPCFLLMPHRQDDHVGSIQTVADHVAAVAKIDDPVTELVVHILDGPTHARLQRQHFDPLTNGRHRPFCCVLILGSQKSVQALHIEQSLGRPD